MAETQPGWQATFFGLPRAFPPQGLCNWTILCGISGLRVHLPPRGGLPGGCLAGSRGLVCTGRFLLVPSLCALQLPPGDRAPGGGATSSPPRPQPEPCTPRAGLCVDPRLTPAPAAGAHPRVPAAARGATVEDEGRQPPSAGRWGLSLREGPGGLHLWGWGALLRQRGPMCCGLVTHSCQLAWNSGWGWGGCNVCVYS